MMSQMGCNILYNGANNSGILCLGFGITAR
jgi:hypothetical protein